MKHTGAALTIQRCASDCLYLTQPTLSRFLAKLEESAGIRLFRRKYDSSLELTEVGKVYLQAARKIDDVWRAMEAELGSLKEQEKHHIRLGFDDDALYNRIQADEATIAERYPKVLLESHNLNSGEIQAAILAGIIDIGFTSFFRSFPYRSGPTVFFTDGASVTARKKAERRRTDPYRTAL